MAKNENLHAAKTAANDEFYTQYNDISNEIPHYRPHFKGKVVYCNCDDPTWSNFWIYFHNNFKSLGLKKLISTHYQKDTEPSYALIYEGGDDFNMQAGKTIEIVGNYSEDGKTFYTAGDFRSDACIELLKEADIVCTNPPFSLFRQYIAQLVEYEKNFLIIGNQNVLTYQEVFPLIKENKVWLGYHSGHTWFGVPKNYKIPENYLTVDRKKMRSNGYMIDENGVIWRNLGNICWFTNLDIQKRHDGLWRRNGKFDNAKAHCYYEGFEDNYPKYDNYDAIEVSKTKDIPIDYPGVMGVPITWLDKYNPDEFEIIDINPHFFSLVAEGKEKPKQLTLKSVNKKDPYARILIRNRNPIKKEDDKGY